MRRHFAKADTANDDDLTVKRRKTGKKVALDISMAPVGPLKETPSVDQPSSFLSELRQHKKPPNPYESAPIPTKELKFNEPGKISRLAQRDRLERDHGSLAIAMPPQCEWWDEQVKIGEHVVELEFEQAQQEPVPIRAFLTPEEQRRKRRNERQAAQAEQRERIKNGEEAAPPPRLSRSNVLAVMGGDYLKDPTRYDQLAREAELERRKKHEQANASRQPTKDEKWQAQAAKLEASRSSGLVCAMYHISDIDSKARYVVDYTAKKYLFTGALVTSGPDSVLVVEGGEREQLKFERLLRKLNCGRLAFKGYTSSRFERWSMHNLTQDQAQGFFDSRGCGLFWKTGLAS